MADVKDPARRFERARSTAQAISKYSALAALAAERRDLAELIENVGRLEPAAAQLRDVVQEIRGEAAGEAGWARWPG